MLRALAARKSLQVPGLGRCYAAATAAIHAARNVNGAGKDQGAGQTGLVQARLLLT
jgi:hypothetical protein